MSNENLSLAQRSLDFINYIEDLQAKRQTLKAEQVVSLAGGAEKVCCITVDAVKGFCTLGPMFSPRSAQVVAPITRIVKDLHSLGVKKFLFANDCHPQKSMEFHIFPPHCVEGGKEAELVQSLQELPFADSFVIIPKTSISAVVDTELEKTLLSDSFKGIKTIVVQGVVIDLCLYQLAMGLKCIANCNALDWNIIVPQSAIATYHTPTGVKVGMPHNGDLMEHVFTYHMQLNGIDVVKDIEL